MKQTSVSAESITLDGKLVIPLYLSRPDYNRLNEPLSHAVQLNEGLLYYHIQQREDDDCAQDRHVCRQLKQNTSLICSVSVFLSTSEGEEHDQPSYLCAQVKDVVPWYFEVKLKAFCKNVRDSSYSISP